MIHAQSGFIVYPGRRELIQKLNNKNIMIPFTVCNISFYVIKLHDKRIYHMHKSGFRCLRLPKLSMRSEHSLAMVSFMRAMPSMPERVKEIVFSFQ